MTNAHLQAPNDEGIFVTVNSKDINNMRVQVLFIGIFV